MQNLKKALPHAIFFLVGDGWALEFVRAVYFYSKEKSLIHETFDVQLEEEATMKRVTCIEHTYVL